MTCHGARASNRSSRVTWPFSLQEYPVSCCEQGPLRLRLLLVKHVGEFKLQMQQPFHGRLDVPARQRLQIARSPQAGAQETPRLARCIWSLHSAV